MVAKGSHFPSGTEYLLVGRIHALALVGYLLGWCSWAKVSELGGGVAEAIFAFAT